MQDVLKSHAPIATRDQLLKLVQVGHLYCLMDPFFKLPKELQVVKSFKLELRDTDPDFFEMIAWDQVTFESPTLNSVNEETLDYLLNAVSTDRWGVFVVSEHPIQSIAEHLQKFVIVRGPDQFPYFLRFQDAAVLETLLQVWNVSQRQLFYGPVRAFGLLNLESLDIEMWHRLQDVSVASLVPEDCLLELTADQLLACSDAIEKDLVRILYWHLVNNHSDSVLHIPREELQRRIEFGITKARSYKLSNMSALAGFVALMFELSPNFDEHPKFNGLLCDESIPSDSKMKMMAHVITEKDWREAKLLSDPDFWKRNRLESASSVGTGSAANSLKKRRGA